MAGFQSTSQVRQFQTTGQAGEIANDGPTRALNWNLLDTNPLVIGNAFTTDDATDGTAIAGGDLSTAAIKFLGVLVRPKEQALSGTTAGTLEPTVILLNNTVGEILSMGQIYVLLAGAGNFGDPLFYTDATGAIDAGTAGAGESDIPNSRLLTTISTGGLAVIELNFGS